MASLPPCKWSLNTTPSYSLYTVNKSPPSSFRLCSVKRRRVNILSLYDSSSSSSASSSSSSSSSNSDSELTKSINLRNSTSRKRVGFGNAANNEVAFVNSVSSKRNPNGSQKELRTFIFKALFGRKSSWRRIVFASTKVRSIILLNVISVVYGKLIPFSPLCLKKFSISPFHSKNN